MKANNTSTTTNFCFNILIKTFFPQEAKPREGIFRKNFFRRQIFINFFLHPPTT